MNGLPDTASRDTGTRGHPGANRPPWAKVLVAVWLLVAGLVLVDGVCKPFDRTYVSFSGEDLAQILAAQGCTGSQLGAALWPARHPLILPRLPLRKGSRVDLRLRTATRRVHVRLVLDGEVKRIWEVVPAWRTYRIWLENDAHSLSLEELGTERVPIHLARIKETNVAGFMEGALNAWVIPRDAPFRRASGAIRWLPFTFLLLIALAVFLAQYASPIPRWLRRGAMGMGIAATAMAGARVLASVQGFRVIFTPTTVTVMFLLPGVVLALFPRRISRAWTGILATFDFPRVRAPLAIGTVVLLWFATLFLVVQGKFEGDIRGVARFGTRFSQPSVLADIPKVNGEGYDGQFYAALSTDPFLRDKETLTALDRPSYRANRVLVPLLAWLSVGGSARHAPFAYVLWCWFLGLAGPLTVFLWLGPTRRGTLTLLLLSFNAGLAVSMLRATPDAAALTFLLAALLLSERASMTGYSVGTATLSVLARETSLLAVPGLAWVDFRAGRWTRGLVKMLVPAGTFLAWWCYVRVITGGDVGSALSGFGFPLAWLSHKAAIPLGGGLVGHAIEWTGMAWVLALLVAAISFLIRRRPLKPLLLTFLLFSLLALFLNIRVYVEVNAYARVLIALPFLAVLLTATEDLKWRRRLLMIGIALASVQGLLLLKVEVDSARYDLKHRREGMAHSRVELATPLKADAEACEEMMDRSSAPAYKLTSASGSKPGAPTAGAFSSAHSAAHPSCRARTLRGPRARVATASAAAWAPGMVVR